MLGEDDDCKDPRAFGSQSALARFSVIFAGPFSILFWHLCLPYLLLGLAGQIRQ